MLAASVLFGCETVTVVTVELDRIEVAPGQRTVIEGETFPLSATLLGPDGERLTGRQILWTTSNPSVAGLSGTIGSQVTVTGLTPGQATVRATAEGVSGQALVEVLAGPALVLASDDVTISGRQGEVSPAVDVAVTNGGNGPITGLSTSVSYGAGAAGWLTVGLNGTTVPTTLTLVAAGGALAVGSYDATVRVASPTAGGLEATLKVTFDVQPPPPSIALQSDDVGLSSTVGDPGEVFVPVGIANGGGGTLSGLAAAVVYPAGSPTGWLTATLSSTTAPATLRVSAVATGLQRGTYTARVAVSSPVARTSPVFVDVTFQVRPPGPSPVPSAVPGDGPSP